MYLTKENFFRSIILFPIINILIIGAPVAASPATNDSVVILKKPNYSIRILKKGFRYSILKPDGEPLLQNHSESGILLLRSPVVSSKLVSKNKSRAAFVVTSDIGVKAKVIIHLFDHSFKMSVIFDDSQVFKGSITARTKGLTPAYGLADHAGRDQPYSTEISGYKSGYFGALTGNKTVRMVSNFVIFPKQGVACINLEPRKKIIAVTQENLAQGTYYTDEMSALYYFIGSPKTIYADFLKVRNKEGYKVYKPKYEWFGVGWEAFGALGYNTDQKTVTEDVDHYLELGFPLKWMVVGSGFWPDTPRYVATTSFGYWNHKKYPNPKAFIDHFHKEGLKFILGLRIAFIPHGPYTEEGLTNDYFIKKNGEPRLFKIGFPKPDCYLLDASNPDAVKWYIELCGKWEAYGVDGYKEDIFRYDIHGLPDDKVDTINKVLMDKGVYVMGRNNYVGSPMDISRYDDFNYNQNQDRGPVNGLAFAYSGFPNVYPDIVGGTGLANRTFGGKEKGKLGAYFMRESQYAALNPSMSFGYGPWNIEDPEVLEICLQAAKLHEKLHPYFYSAAIRAYKTGFPYPLTPLPLAYPKDSNTYYRANERVRGYQWLIGDALMAVPLYGNDYATSNTRDVYLPEGKWIDYDNGEVYQGPTTLKDFALPVDKTPLFVGGTGFVVKKAGGKLLGRVYNVGFEGKTIFYGENGETKSTIRINRFIPGGIKIMDLTTNQPVEFRKVRHALEFIFIPGHDYEVK